MVTKKILHFIIATGLIVLPFLANAQYDDTFRKDSAGFIEDLHDFMEKIDRLSDKGENAVNRIEMLWEEGKVSDTVKNTMYKVANTLRARKARSFPHFYDWLTSTAIYLEKNQINQNFFSYQKALITLSQKRDIRLRHIARFIETIKKLKAHNYINQNGSTIWRSNAGNYTFNFTKDTMRIHFPVSTLTCKAVRDSIKIHNTEGNFDPIDRIWYGKSGKTFWTRAGYSKDSVFAEYDHYTIDMQLSNFKVDSAVFYNLHFYDDPLMGKLHDQVTEIKKPQSAAYPEFISYNTNFRIDRIFKDINYIGGFSMRGAQLFGSGSENKEARIEVFRDVEVVKNGDTLIQKMLFMKALSEYFVFTDKKILSRNAEIVMSLDQDSLYHPGLQFTYLNKNREITLLRDDNAPNMSRSPYYDSYHRFEIDALVANWKVGDNQLYLTSLRNTSINNAAFSSFNLFNKKNYNVFQGFDFKHPFFKIRSYLNEKDTRHFTATEIARVLQQPKHEAIKILLRMTYLGFANYDNDTKKGFMKQKFYDYLLNVTGRKDYDLIKIESTTEGDNPNAILDLRNLDIYVNGVPQVHISDAKRVNIYPKHEEIVLKGNRNIDFAGVIETGYYTFFGNSFHFNYEEFGVELEHIDSLHIKVVDYYDNYDDPVFKQVQSTIEDITGNVLIDKPDNKSGIKENPEYPIFKSTKDSYVYYDRRKIAKGVYTRDTFYFRIDPYVIDSLNSFDAQGLKYTGTFHPGNIFPAVDEELQLQADNSLGLNYETPDEGLPVYQGRGQYYDSISMSNQGLKGDGKLEYLSSTTWSDEFKFYPDTMRTLANRYINNKQKQPYEGPEIEAQALDILWYLELEKMYYTTTDQLAEMYNGQGKLKGTFYMNNKGVGGHGKFIVENGRFRSDEYTFLADQVKASVTDFAIKSIDKEALAFDADSISTTVDFPSRMARFEANSVMKPMFFPANQYKAYINTFEWGIDRNALALKGNSVHRYEEGKHRLQATPDKRHPKGNLFVSKHPLQHELNFISPEADVDLSKNMIYTHEVQLIEIADATVYPGDGDFTIKPEARYKTLVDAEIEANNETKYHQFYNATVNIQSRKKYTASGHYDYIDKNKKKHPIRFDVISVDSAENTFARGKILGDDDFTLSPAFNYRGDVYLYAQLPYLKYDGSFRAIKNCDMYAHQWVKFEDTLKPQKIQIPVDSITYDINNNRVYKGLMLEHDSIHILPLFFAPKNHYTDYPVATARGYLQYDETGHKYEIADKTKLNNSDTLLNYLSVNTNNCNMYGEGELSFTGDYGQPTFKNFGNVTFNKEQDEVIMDLFMAIDFFLDKQCLEYMADTMRNFKGLKPINMLAPSYRKGLMELVGYNMTSKLLNEQKLFGAFKKFPKELQHTMIISDANFKWYQEDGTFHSFGNIGISSIKDIQVNKYVSGAIQTGTSRTGDYFTIYLELSPSYWFFFRYKRGIMAVVSSDPAFNQIISDLRSGQRKQDVDRGEPKFYYHLGSKRDKIRFLEEFNEAEEAAKLKEEQKNSTQDENNTPADSQNQKGKAEEQNNTTEAEEKPKNKSNSDQKNNEEDDQ